MDADWLRLYGCSWTDVPVSRAAALTAVMLRQEESWTLRAIDEDWRWRSLDTHLLADQVDRLSWLVWSKTQAAADGGDPPTPMRRAADTVADQERTSDQDSTSELMAVSADEIDDLLAAPRGPSTQVTREPVEN